MNRPLGACLGAVAWFLVLPAAASADVLVHSPPSSVRCGQSIKLGVWYQSYSGGPRGATITIRTVTGKTVSRRTVRAADNWKYFYYRGRCGRTYKIRYTVPGGKVDNTVRVRSE